jgi:hypothetical protein
MTPDSVPLLEPALSVSAPPFVAIFPEPLIDPVEPKITANAPAVEVMSAPSEMLLSAVRVRVAFPPLVLLIADDKVILPVEPEQEP